MKNYYFILFLFLIIIIITIIFIIFYAFNYEKPDDIIFLSKEEAQQFIRNDNDNYIKNLSIYDLRARNVKTNAEYLNIVINSCLDFNENQKEKLRYCATEAKKFYNNNIDWIFAHINNNYEQGYPHTRGTIIFISNNTINSNENILIKTLIHESVHIYQRYNKEKIQEYLIKNNYYISRIRNNNSLIRANPDLDEYIYKDDNSIEMIANYSSEYPKEINDITLKNLSYEHPFEKMAYELGEEYTKTQLMKYKYIPE